MFMQDVPFLAIRLYTIVRFDVINYSLVFFTSKNILVICLLFYKIGVLLNKRCSPDKEKQEDNIQEFTADFQEMLKGNKKGIVIKTADGLMILRNNGENIEASELKRRSLTSLNSNNNSNNNSRRGIGNDYNNSRRAIGNDYTNMVQPAVSVNDSDIATDPPSVQPYTIPNPVPEVFPSSESINKGQPDSLRLKDDPTGQGSLRSTSSKGNHSIGSERSKTSQGQDSVASSNNKNISSIASSESKGYNSMKSNKSSQP